MKNIGSLNRACDDRAADSRPAALSLAAIAALESGRRPAAAVAALTPGLFVDAHRSPGKAGNGDCPAAGDADENGVRDELDELRYKSAFTVLKLAVTGGL